MGETANPRGFGSDNHSGIHPEVLAAIAVANEGHVHAYGDDPYTERMVAQFRRHFGDQAEVFPMLNGTGANVAALSSLVRPWSAIICAETAHVNVDESTASERFIGCRLIDVPSADGKLTPDGLRAAIRRVGDVHHPQAAAVVITQSTEYGTVYTPDQIRAISDVAHEHSLRLFMDGARISNAAVALDLPFRAFTTDAGVDALTFGGTKNGLMFGEVTIFLTPDLATEFSFIRKQAMQLASKMRFVACQFETLLRDGLWKRNAAHANAMAARLSAAIADVPGLTITQKVEANVVFATLPREHIGGLRDRTFFYEWDERIGEVRLMCTWDTTDDDVDTFAADIRRTLSTDTG